MEEFKTLYCKVEKKGVETVPPRPQQGLEKIREKKRK